jgi:hypothetical protein
MLTSMNAELFNQPLTPILACGSMGGGLMQLLAALLVGWIATVILAFTNTYLTLKYAPKGLAFNTHASILFTCAVATGLLFTDLGQVALALIVLVPITITAQFLTLLHQRHQARS